MRAQHEFDGPFHKYSIPEIELTGIDEDATWEHYSENDLFGNEKFFRVKKHNLFKIIIKYIHILFSSVFIPGALLLLNGSVFFFFKICLPC